MRLFVISDAERAKLNPLSLVSAPARVPQKVSTHLRGNLKGRLERHRSRFSPPLAGVVRYGNERQG